MKGNCYEVAGRMVMDNDLMVLCHGLATGSGPLKGQLIAHAWCELGDEVFDYSDGKHFVGRKEKYYEIGKITKVVKYSALEACKLMLKTGHFGPWDNSVSLDWLKK